MMRLRRRLPALLSTAALLGLAGSGTAAAQSGVHIDPGSPSGKEYEIPLETARREATAGHGELDSVEQGSRTAPLFGEGIGDDDDSSGDGGGGKKDNGGSGGGKSSGDPQDSTSSETGGDTVGDAISGTRALQATVPEGGTGSALTIGALAVSVLLLGGVLGSIARRRQQP
jgi:hypothetical protein